MKKIDAVYTWVDGNDSNWLNKKEAFIRDNPSLIKNKKVNSKGRFFDNKELKYSLRSLDQYAPWINNVYLVTDNQVPKWLNINHPKINIIDHKDIFDSNNLPCFNSNAIEIHLHKIKNLSNQFLSFNDDFFIGRKSTVDDFFINGEPKLFCGKKRNELNDFDETVLVNEYQYANYNARLMIYEKYNYFPSFNLRHGIKPLDKKTLEHLEEIFLNKFKDTQKNHFRTKNDIWIIGLYAFYMAANKLSNPYYIKPLRKDLMRYKIPFLRKGRDYTYVSLNQSSLRKINSKFSAIKKYTPLMFCINDGPNVSDYKRSIVKSFLKEFYPNKSSFEK